MSLEEDIRGTLVYFVKWLIESDLTIDNGYSESDITDLVEQFLEETK